MSVDTIEVYQREDRLWGWRRRAHENGQIIATDGSQGYEHRDDAEAGAIRSMNYAGLIFDPIPETPDER